MARKISITKEMLINSAFDMAREEGLTEVTARKLASRTGCSTQPIFRVYSNMDELYDEVYQKAVAYFSDFYGTYQGESKVPFANLGMAYIEFAAKEPQMFRMLFMEEKRCNASLFGILNGKTNALHQEIAKAKAQGAKDPSDIFMKMWIFIHGAACMMMTGDYDLSMKETEALLETSYASFIK
ncbi:MAG: TetR/AcrR family transcriptional regulator [Lachnospiraceae bacterium]